MKLSESSFSIFFLDEEKNILKSLWSDFTSNLDDELFKQELWQEVAWIEKYKPQSYLVDTRFFNFVIQLELQVWISEFIFPYYIKNGLKKIAFLRSQGNKIETFNRSLDFETKYFDDEKAATTWLSEVQYQHSN